MIHKIIHTKSTSLKKTAGLFLDRDGVINRCPKPHQYVTSWSEMIVHPEIIQLIKDFNVLGFPIIVITNQRGISRGRLSNQKFREISKQLFKHLSTHQAFINATYYCPHGYEDKCSCRKPKPGLIKQAIRDFNIDPSKSILIGDSTSDSLAAKSAKIHSIVKIKKNNPPNNLLFNNMN